MVRQNDGKGVFTQVERDRQVDGDGDLGAWGHTIGSSFGDLDNDGHLDLFVGNFSHPPAYQDRPKFMKNLGPERGFSFQDLTGNAGLSWQESFASPTLGDFDNDGLLDLYFTTVYPGDHCVLYRNKGDFKFENVTASSGISADLTYQAAWADIDNDGDLDLATRGRLYLNNSPTKNYLKIKVIGSNKTATNSVGTIIRIKLGDKTLTRQVTTSTGQGNGNSQILHFGLGDHNTPVLAEVSWIGQSKTTVELKPNTMNVVTSP